MKKVIICGVVLTAVLAFKVKNNLTTPEATVKAFVSAMQKEMYSEAKKHATASSVAAIDMVAGIQKSTTATKAQKTKLANFKASTFALGKTIIKGNNAVTTIIFTNNSKSDTSKISSTNTNDNWKINFSK